MKLVSENIIRFVLLVLLQVFLLDNIQFLGYINPMIYIVFILALPLKISRNLSIFLSFLMGFTIDMFSNTMGMHALASTTIGFLRLPIIKMFLDTEDLINISFKSSTFGFKTYFKYMILMVFIHHFILFSVEAFSFYMFHHLVLKLLVSSLITILIISLLQLLNTRKPQQR